MKIYIINTYHNNRERKIKGYVEFLKKSGADPVVLYENELYKIDAPAVISGSHKMVGEGEISEELINFIANCKYPLAGICYGHQAIANTFGWKVVRCRRQHKGREKIKKIRDHPLLEGLPDEFIMDESHFECVEKTNQEFDVIALSHDEKDGEIIEIIAHKDRPVYGFQFHPERSGDEGEILMRNFLKIIKKTSL